MIFESSLALIAFISVVFGIAGSPYKDGKITKTGVGVLTVAFAALVLSIAKSYQDSKSSEKKDADIATMHLQLKGLKGDAERNHKASSQASAETANLKAGIRAIFESIRIENDKLVADIPNSILVKDTIGPGILVKEHVKVPKYELEKNIDKFQKQVDGLESNLMKKVQDIEHLFTIIAE